MLACAQPVRRRRAPALALVGAIALAGCGQSAPRPQETLVTPADVLSALAPLPGGGLLYANRVRGEVRRADAAGRPVGGVVARVPVSAEGQRGLLGLARDPRGRLFAAWTDRSKRLVVALVAPGRWRLVWRGPSTPTLGIGGRLALSPDGRLVIGVGDLEQRARIADPRAPNGKLLSLDPDGPPGQRPRLLSSGWNNPFAFVFTPGGQLWVADNAVGKAPERLARGDLGKRPARVTDLPTDTAPSGLAAVSDRDLVVCGYVSHQLLPYRVGPQGRARPAGPALATDCVLGVVRVASGRLAYARRGTVGFVDLPSRAARG